MLVLARGGELRGHREGEVWKGGLSLPRIFFEFKKCAFLYTFKVYRFHRNSFWPQYKSLFPSSFPEPQRQEPGSIAVADTSSTFFIHFFTLLLKALQLIGLHWNGRTGLRVREGITSLINDIFCWKLVENQTSLTSVWSLIPPIPCIRLYCTCSASMGLCTG